MISNPYILPLIRWWRLVVIVTVLAAGASAVSTVLQPDNYVSKTTLMIGTTFLNPNPDSGQIYIAQQLAQIYAEMARREPVQDATKTALGINWLPQYQSRVVPNTQLIEISVTDTNPRRAQIVASELANQLKLQSPTIGNTETGDRQDFIAQQLSSLQQQIQETQSKIEELQKSMVGLNSASQIANIEKEISSQSEKLVSLRASYSSFLANSQEGAVNMVSIVEPANLPAAPIGTSKLMMVVLAGLVGIVLGGGAAYLLEYLDRTIKTTSDVERVLKLPVIGYLSEFTGDGSKGTYVSKSPDSIFAENYRLLCSNIGFFRASHPIKTIMITSPNPGAGKTTVACNLAWSISQGEHNVILVDADLRRPSVHTALEMASSCGLSEVISNAADIQSVVRPSNGAGSFQVLTAGEAYTKIAESALPKKMSVILSQLKESHELVIIDSPPLIIASSYDLASIADGVVIVMKPGDTPSEQARAIREQLERAGAKLVGVVFNRISRDGSDSYYDSHYHSLYSPKYYGDYYHPRTTGDATTAPPADESLQRSAHRKPLAGGAKARGTPLGKLLKRNGKS